jgi:hypothetical protein
MGFVKREEFDELAAEVQRLKKAAPKKSATTKATRKAAPKKKVVKK